MMCMWADMLSNGSGMRGSNLQLSLSLNVPPVSESQARIQPRPSTCCQVLAIWRTEPRPTSCMLCSAGMQVKSCWQPTA